MSTLQLENIKHPDASGNALELASDGTLAVGNKFTGNVITTHKFSCDTDTTPPTDGAAYFYKQSAGTTVSGYQAIIETGSAGSRNNSMVIDYAGRVTTPYQPSFLMNVNGAVSYGTGWQKIDLVSHNSTYDVGGGADYTNNRYTAPVTGKYFFSLAVTLSVGTPDTDGTITLYKNGAQTLVGVSMARTEGSLDGTAASFALSLTAGDYVELYSYHTAGGNVTTRDTNFAGYLSGFLIG